MELVFEHFHCFNALGTNSIYRFVDFNIAEEKWMVEAKRFVKERDAAVYAFSEWVQEGGWTSFLKDVELSGEGFTSDSISWYDKEFQVATELCRSSNIDSFDESKMTHQFVLNSSLGGSSLFGLERTATGNCRGRMGVGVKMKRHHSMPF